VRADVGDLSRAGRARQVHELVADRDHRHAGLGVHEHLVATGRGQHGHLGGADHGVPTDRHVAGLHVLADPPHEGRRRHALVHPEARGATVGVRDRDHGVGERRQRSPRRNPHGLAWLQPKRLPGAGPDLPDDGDGHRIGHRGA
jgi:hypothetical protein